MTAPKALCEPSTGDRLRLRRSWPRGQGHLLLEYVRADGSAVAGQWFAGAARLDRVAEETPAPAEVVPGTGVLLQAAGADRKLPAVQRLLRRPGSTLVAHRPERRAVVRQAQVYAKVTRQGRVAPPVLPAAASPGAFTTPRLVDHDPSTGTTLWTALPGRTLHDAGADSSWREPEVRSTWTSVGRALRILHDTPADDAVPRHDAAREHETTTAWLDAAAAYGLLPRFDARAALLPLRSRPAGPPGLLHRDLHDKQLLLLPEGGIGVVDLDTLAVGERALDLANVLAHLELRAAQGLLAARRATLARSSLLAGYAADTATLTRIPAYLTATRLRLRAVYAFRPPLTPT